LTRGNGIFGSIVNRGVAICAVAIIQAVSWAGTGQPSDKGNPQEESGETLIKQGDCTSCHALDRKVVGPSYSDVAKRYAGQSDAVEKLSRRIREGGAGSWGDVPMTPHPSLTDKQLSEIAKWILSLNGKVAALVEAQTELHTYTLKDGKTVKLDFLLFVEGVGQKVTKNVFRGYELYDSYCFRCHGLDATGGELAPDLRHSLSAGMTQQEFLSVAMAGRKEKGMPSWADFFSQEEVKDIYEYVEGRSLELVPAGRPPSETE
jgi:cytochrome c